MRVNANEYSHLVAARGAGVFGQVEFTDRNDIVLRTAEVRTNDVSGAVRVYFNSQREQVVSGMRFDLMGSGLVLMRPGTFYRIQTSIEIVEPIPEGVSAIAVLARDIADVMSVTSMPLESGFVGQVCFTVLPYRKVELERMTSLARLVFFEDACVKNTKSPNRMKTESRPDTEVALTSGKKPRVIAR